MTSDDLSVKLSMMKEGFLFCVSEGEEIKRGHNVPAIYQ